MLVRANLRDEELHILVRELRRIAYPSRSISPADLPPHLSSIPTCSYPTFRLMNSQSCAMCVCQMQPSPQPDLSPASLNPSRRSHYDAIQVRSAFWNPRTISALGNCYNAGTVPGFATIDPSCVEQESFSGRPRYVITL